MATLAEGQVAKNKGGRPKGSGKKAETTEVAKPPNLSKHITKFLALEERMDMMRKEAVGIRDRVIGVQFEQGRILLDVKEKLAHGNFGKWVADSLNITPDYASKLQGIARAFPKGLPKLESGRDPTVAMLIDATRSVKAGVEPREAVRAAVSKAESQKAAKTAEGKKGKKSNGQSQAEPEVLPPEDPGQGLSDALALVGIEGPGAALAQITFSKETADLLVRHYKIEAWASLLLSDKVQA